MDQMMPQGQGQQMMQDPNQLMAMLMELLSSPPDVAAGGVPRSLPPATIPADILNSDPMAALMPLLMQLQGQMGQMQSGQQMQNGAMGAQGGPMGAMGGRPPAGSVPPSALR